MANKKSAQKRIRTSDKARIANTRRKREVKKNVKDLIREATGEKKDVNEIKELLRKLGKSTDKAAKQGVIHPNKAARIKSRTMQKVFRTGFRGK